MADFQADEDDRGQMTGWKGQGEDVQEQLFGTRELMPSCPVAELESRVDRNFSTFSGAQDTESRSSWAQLGRVCTKSEGLGTQDLEANTELRHSAFSWVESAVVPFVIGEGMEGEHIPDTDLTRCHQVLEEGDRFES